MVNIVDNSQCKLSELREYKVVKSNDLIQKTRFELSLQEHRIIMYLISKIKPEDNDFEYQQFDIVEFCKICGIETNNGKNYINIKTTIKTLADKSFYFSYEKKIDNNEGTKEPVSSLVRWITKARVYENTGKIEIKLDDDLKPYLLQLKEKFTQYALLYVLAMKSQYSVRLYEILKSYEFIHKKTFDINELKIMLDATNYTRYNDFYRNVIEIAMKEINNLSDIQIELSIFKEGRRYAKMEFTIKLKKNIVDRTTTWSNISKIIDKPKTNHINNYTQEAITFTQL